MVPHKGKLQLFVDKFRDSHKYFSIPKGVVRFSSLAVSRKLTSPEELRENFDSKSPTSHSSADRRKDRGKFQR